MESGPTLCKNRVSFSDMDAEYFDNTMAVIESGNSVEQVERQEAGQGMSTPAPPKKGNTRPSRNGAARGEEKDQERRQEDKEEGDPFPSDPRHRRTDQCYKCVTTGLDSRNITPV